MDIRTDTVLQKLEERLIVGDGCWGWKGGTTSGYGQVWLRETGHKYEVKHLAHRVVYELLVGPIPDGLELDHLCRNRACTRPDHLEPVTRRENILRGAGRAAVNAKKTHCPEGHPYSPMNTYVHPRTHRRTCIACRENHRYGR